MNLRNFCIFIAIVIGILVYSNSQIKQLPEPKTVNNISAPQAVTKETALAYQPVVSKDGKIKLVGVEGIKYSFAKLPDNVIAYLQEKEPYKQAFAENKKFLRYFVGVGCPYGKMFTNAVNATKSNPAYAEKYEFYGEKFVFMKRYKNNAEMEADSKFFNMCKEFCIVNPQNGQIFAIDGVGEQEAAKIDTILGQLRNW